MQLYDERYIRHYVLREIGAEGQKKLLSGKVLVIGAGGLGSAALYYLAAAGVGTLGIADNDTVAVCNLQRQIIHSTATVGMSKVKSASEAVARLNPDVKVVPFGAVGVENISEIIDDFDFVLDCTDRFQTKFMINDACVLAQKPYCHAGVVRFEGQVMTYVPKQGPCLRCLIGDVPSKAESQTCAEVGVLGAAVGITGSIQALEAIKFLCGIGQLLVGRVFKFDGLNMRVRVAEFPSRNEDCSVCGAHPTITSLSANAADYKI